MKFLKNYQSSLVLLLAVTIGGVIGVLKPDIALYLKPIGDLFLNFMYILIVPLVFLSIVSAIIATSQAKRLGKILSRALVIFVVTALIAALLSYVLLLAFNPTKGIDTQSIMSSLPPVDSSVAERPIGDTIVETLSVSNFLDLFSKSNLLPLIIFSFLLGIAIQLTGEKAEPLKKVIRSASETMTTLVNIIMKAAPIGLACYFSYTISQLGSQILAGYLKTLVVYIIFTVIYYFGFFSIYAFVSAGSTGVKAFWENALTPSLTAIATASSAACIPINIISAKNIGVSEDIAETVIPLGVNTHKDGSVGGGVFKLVFLFGLYARSYGTIDSAFLIIGVAMIAGIVIGAIPSGGLTGEILMVSLFGFPPEMVAVIAIISTIIDIPATLLNSTGNIVCAMLTERFVEGKNWLVKRTVHKVKGA